MFGKLKKKENPTWRETFVLKRKVFGRETPLDIYGGLNSTLLRPSLKDTNPSFPHTPFAIS